MLAIYKRSLRVQILCWWVHVETQGRLHLGTQVQNRWAPEAQRQVWRRPSSGRVACSSAPRQSMRDYTMTVSRVPDGDRDSLVR